MDPTQQARFIDLLSYIGVRRWGRGSQRGGGGGGGNGVGDGDGPLAFCGLTYATARAVLETEESQVSCEPPRKIARRDQEAPSGTRQLSCDPPRKVARRDQEAETESQQIWCEPPRKMARRDHGPPAGRRGGHLAVDMVSNILCRLPVRALLRFKLVCKPWRDLISEPHFISKHMELSKADRLCLLVLPTRLDADYVIERPLIFAANRGPFTRRLEAPLAPLGCCSTPSFPAVMEKLLGMIGGYCTNPLTAMAWSSSQPLTAYVGYDSIHLSSHDVPIGFLDVHQGKVLFVTRGSGLLAYYDPKTKIHKEVMCLKNLVYHHPQLGSFERIPGPHGGDSLLCFFAESLVSVSGQTGSPI